MSFCSIDVRSKYNQPPIVSIYNKVNQKNGSRVHDHLFSNTSRPLILSCFKVVKSSL